MKQFVEKVSDLIIETGLVEVEVSARHVHLTQEDVEILFGEGAELHPKRPLSQPGQYLCEERVTLIGPKGRKERVAVLGPVRKATQVELSLTDCAALGVKAPVRESGDLSGAGPIAIETDKARLEKQGAVIVAKAHVHITPEIAARLDLENGEHVSVRVMTERPVTFDNVVIRVSDKFRFKMHIDFDEANAAGVSGFTLGKILKHED